ncbi:MAG: SDR family NAD(P)-dependent oxidoreductase [Bacteroidales bacterium]|nr:SDR family NAD(P)-dependent oxidoreductase [Bacteroidales bacterium]
MIAYITGATSGFGKAIAQKLAQMGYDMVITGRRKERLDTLAEELIKQYHIKVLVSCYDVRDNNAVEQAIVSLPQEWKNIDVLVNNAGLAVGAVGIQNGELDDWNRMIDTNIKGLLYVSRQIMPLMVARKSGHIINLGSVAGKEVYPNGNVYCATKHAVDAISKAMRVDMLPYGIKVSQICPGAAETEFSLVRYKGDQEAADKVYKGYQPLVAEDIADVVGYLVSLPKHVCINDLVITCLSQANTTNFYKK